MIKQIIVFNTLVDRIKEYLMSHNLGNKGVEDGSPRKQEVGLIGELVVHNYLFDEYPNLFDKLDGFDGGFDMLFQGKKIDVKTMERKSYVRPNFVNNFYIMQKHHNADIIVFCSYHSVDNVIEICGCLPKNELHTRGIFYAAGTRRNRADGSFFVFRQDNYEVEVKDLDDIDSLKYSKLIV